MGTTKTRGVILDAASEVLLVRGLHGSPTKANLQPLHKGVDLDLCFVGKSPIYLRGEEGPAREEIFRITTPMRKQPNTL